MKLSRLVAMGVGAIIVGQAIAVIALPTVSGDSVTSAQTQQFIDTWIARFDDAAWMTHYLNSTDVVNDGFGDLSNTTKLSLVLDLMSAYAVHNASFNAMIDPAGANTTVVNQHHAIAAQILYGIVFDKNEFMSKMMNPVKTPPPDAVATPTNSTYFPGLSVTDIASHMNAMNNESMKLPDLGALTKPLDLTGDARLNGTTSGFVPLETYPTAAPIDLPAALHGAGYAPPALGSPELPTLPTTSLAGQIDLPHDLTNNLTHVTPPELGLIGDLVAPVPPQVLGVLNTVVAAATYNVCWQTASDTTVHCTTVPEPLDAPTPIDVNGDKVPDVVATIAAPASPTTLPDPSVSLDVRRVDATNLANPLRVYVFAVYKIPTTLDSYAVAGVDGREVTLPQATTATVSLSDVLTPNPGIHLRLATGAAGSAATLVGGLVHGRTAPSGSIAFFDPILEALRLSPVPSVFSVDFSDTPVAHFIGTTLERGTNISTAIDTTDATRVTSTLYQETEQTSGPTKATVIQGDVNRLPRHLSLAAALFPSGTHIAYSASAAIGSVSFLEAAFADASDLTTFTLGAGVTVSNFPTEVSVTADAGGFHYTANGNVAQVTFAAGNVAHLAYTSLQYAEVDSVPTQVDLTTANGQTDLTTSQPIGTIVYFAFSGRGTPYALAGDHFLSVSQGLSDGSTFSLMSARLSGLQEAHAQITADRTTASVRLVGGEPFYVLTQELDAAGNGRTILGYVSNLPPSLAVTLQGSKVTYSAGKSINTVAVEMIDTSGSATTTLYGEVDGVPTGFHLSMDAANGEVKYDATSTVPRIVVYLQKATPGDTQTFIGEIDDLPSSVMLQWSTVANTFAFRTDRRLGRILAQVSDVSSSGTKFAFAEVDSLPTTILASWSNGGTVDFTTDSYIGGVTLAASNFGGYYSLPGDGVLAYDVGGRQSVYAHITGLSGFHASIAQQFFSLDLAHPTPFTVEAFSDTKTAYLYLSALPAHVEVAFTGTTVLYKASSKIPTVVAYYTDGTQTAYATFTGVPSEVLLNFGVNPSFNMPDQLDRVNFAYWKGRAPASICCGDNVVVVQDPSGALSVTGQISAIRSFSTDFGGSHITLDLSDNLPFLAYVSTPSLFAYATLTNVPGHITIDAQASSITYSSTNAIAQATAYVATNGNVAYASVTPVPRLITASWTPNSVTVHTDIPIQNIYVVGQNAQGVVSVNINQIPSTMSVSWNIAQGSGSVTYNADSTLGSITVQASSGPKAAFLQVTGIPAHMQASWAEKSASLTTSSPIGSIWVMATNDGSFSYLGGDHALYYNSGASTRASFKLSGLRGFSFGTSGDTTTASLSLAGGQIFSVYLYDDTNGRRMYANGWFGPLPQYTTLNLGPVTTVSLSSNMDIAVYFEAGTPGALASVPGPYWTHGLVARATSDLSAVKATLYLTGLPTYVMLDPANSHYTVNGFAPRIPWIFADFAKPDLSGQAYLGSPANNYDFRMVQGDKSTWLYFNANVNMGNAWAAVTTPNDAGYVSISNIPASLTFGYSAPAGASTNVYYSSNVPISDIFVGYHKPWVGFWQAYINLQNLPTYVSMSIGRNANGMTMSYFANSNSLSLQVYVDPSLFSGALSARVYAAISNIGSYTALYQAGDGSYNLYSSPGIGSIYVDISATYTYSYSKTGGNSAWWYSYSYYLYFSAYVQIDHLDLYAEGVRDISLKPEIPALNFQYFDANYFVFGWQSIYVSLGINAGASISLLGWTIFSINWSWYPSFYVNIGFDTWWDHWYSWASICALGACASINAHPHPHYHFENSFALWNCEFGECGISHRYVFINPFDIVPWWIEWIYMTFAKGGISLSCC